MGHLTKYQPILLLLVLLITGCITIMYRLNTADSFVTDEHNVENMHGKLPDMQEKAMSVKKDKPVVCPQRVRSSRMQHWCKMQQNKSQHSYEDFTTLSESVLKSHVQYLYADEKHKVLYCAIAKAGSGTWKQILANNSLLHDNQTLLESKSIHTDKYLQNMFNLTSLSLLDRASILHRLRTYYSFLVVRHPLDRLISAYKNKLTGHNELYDKILVRLILKEVRPQSGPSMQIPDKGATFHEYIQYITKHHMTDRHFMTYQDNCYPCSIHYNYIAKLETEHHDATEIVSAKLSGRGLDTFRNRGRGGATSRQELAEFRNVSKRMVNELMEVYGADMSMFGYSVEYNNGSVWAQCGDMSTSTCC